MDDVNVSVLTLKVPSVESKPVIVTVTSAVGCASNTMVNVFDVPDSEVIKLPALSTAPLVLLGAMVRPRGSLSIIVAVPITLSLTSLKLGFVNSPIANPKDIENSLVLPLLPVTPIRALKLLTGVM